MTDRFWSPSDEHPPLAELLLHLEGELNARESAAVTRHLHDCWECRTRCATIERGIRVFMEARRDVLLPSVSPPPIDPCVARRLREKSAGGFTTQMPIFSADVFQKMFAWPSAAAWVGVVVSAIVIGILFTLPLVQPVRLSAAEFLIRAQAAGARSLPLPGKVRFQRVEIRHGARVIQREIELEGPVAPVSTTARDIEWMNLLAAVPINWHNPLDVESYVQWRKSKVHYSDSVSEASDFATLSTVPTSNSNVRRASLTIRKSDWHAVAKRVEMAAGEPIEVRELEYGVRDLLPPAPVTASSPTVAGGAPKPAPPALPTAAELDTAEVGLREVLYRLHADVEELPQIDRSINAVHLHLQTSTAERRDELIAAIGQIPYVVLDISEVTPAPTADASGAMATEPLAPVYATVPPLANDLWSRLGGMNAANNYLESVRERYRETLVNALALDRLAARYSPREWQSLSPDLQARVETLAAAHVESIRRYSDAYLSQLSTVLDAMLEHYDIETPPAENIGDCGDWRAAGGTIAEDLRRLQISFRRLFLVDEVEKPLRLSAGDLLNEAAAWRARLSNETSHVCSSAHRE